MAGEIDTEIFFLGDLREEIARFFALRDPEERGEPATHWGIVQFTPLDVEKATDEHGNLVVTKLRVLSFPDSNLDISELLEGKIYREAAYDKPGEWMTVDDIDLLDQEIGTL